MSILSDLKWFFLILIVNTLISIVYLILKLIFSRKDNRKSFVIKSIVMLLCPVLGPLFYAGSFLLYLVFFNKEVDLSDVVFSKERVEAGVNAEEERERNLVSIEEAVSVTDRNNLRNLMMNVVREDVSESLNSISIAMDSTDSETAHYAASVLQDVLNEFRTHVQKAYRDLMDDEDDTEEEAEEKQEARVTFCRDLVRYMNEVLSQQVFTAVEQRSFALVMEEVCEIIYKADPKSMEPDLFEAIALRLLDADEFEHCEIWCQRAAELYPDTLMQYVCRMKLYFKQQDRDRFEQTMNELKQSDVVIDRETLELIRVFM